MVLFGRVHPNLRHFRRDSGFALRKHEPQVPERDGALLQQRRQFIPLLRIRAAEKQKASSPSLPPIALGHPGPSRPSRTPAPATSLGLPPGLARTFPGFPSTAFHPFVSGSGSLVRTSIGSRTLTFPFEAEAENELALAPFRSHPHRAIDLPFHHVELPCSRCCTCRSAASTALGSAG